MVGEVPVGPQGRGLLHVVPLDNLDSTGGLQAGEILPLDDRFLRDRFRCHRHLSI